jgi:dethiobiotin synthetase
MKRIFVTGISTDVGKTVVSAILTEALKADYWKPVQSGSFHATDSEEIKKLISNKDSVVHAESYCLQQPMSPHAAAELEGVEIHLDNIKLPSTSNTLVIEGAGGLMVPLNQKDLVIDIIKKFDADVILVIRNYLGSINHSLLSIDALRNRGLKLVGIVINGAPHKLSEDIIIKYAGVPCIGRIMPESEVNAEVISMYAKKFQVDKI